MKMNIPVTNNERLMKTGTILVTRTDLKGVITFVNDAFVEISGYSHHELIGASHNVVRHPDMPQAAFEDMWSTIKKGNPWHGVVKNRSKSGDFYWVNANVMPLLENNVAIGYISVRHAPLRSDIIETEALYRKIAANQAVLHATGFAAFLKKIKEISLGKKLAFASTFLVAPNVFLMSEFFNAAHYGSLSVAAGLTVFGGLMVFNISHNTCELVELSINELYRLSTDRFAKPPDLKRNDKFGELLRAIYGTGIRLGSDLGDLRQSSSDALRVISGLENVQSSVLIADANLEIIFVNKAAQQLFSNAENDIRKDLPNFKAANLLGSKIDIFHKNPEYQRNLLKGLTDSITSQLTLAGRSMQVIAKPVIASNGERIGYVAEWQDRTLEAKIEQEIVNLVNSIKVGNLSARIRVDDKEGFEKSLSININELTDIIENVFVDINTIIEKMADGDLTNSIQSDYQGIYAECKDHINDAISKISHFILQIRETAEFVNNSSQEMASGNNNLSQRVEQQASSLEQTAASMNDLSHTVKSNAENTQQATKVVESATQLAEKGGEVVKSAIGAMLEINESSNRIAEIIGVIDEIAFQTNLLALNASVEAARAGEQGRGFSVVATEVRNLAQRSATAAAQSSELIQNSVQKVRSGTAFVNETGAALMEIVDSIIRVGDIVGQITESSDKQSTGISQVNQAVAQMDDITQQNSALAEEAAANSMAMSEQSAKMSQLLNFFKVSDKNLSTRSQTSTPMKQPVAKMKSPALPVSTMSSGNDDWEEF
ncbi:MAG: methyl-accepting chemotaxis protein [Methylococcaceae bacterium]